MNLDEMKKQQGPWNNEPDELRFMDETTGLECYIMRHPEFGHLCGYVIIPKDKIDKVDHLPSPYWDSDPNLPDVYGGVTFKDILKQIDEYCIGFDCAHTYDWSPFIMSKFYADNIEATYKDIEFVKAECIKLAKQLHDLMEDK